MDDWIYINTAFENGSIMDWEVLENGVVEIRPVFDYEQGPMMNRQLTHWHFRLHGVMGQKMHLRIPPCENIYGGQKVNAFARRTASQMSVDKERWLPFEFLQQDDSSLLATFKMPADTVYIARVEPYTTWHLNSLLTSLKNNPNVQIEIIGHTVEGRELEMLNLASMTDKPLILLRGRAHPWEAGGNWFLEGIISEALKTPQILDKCTFSILPMAAKDGVVRGQTRFNLNGYDLNRGFRPDYAFDMYNAPENQALMQWLERKQQTGNLPVLAIDLHNDDWGNLHTGPGGIDTAHDRRMDLLDRLMREKTYYTEGMSQGAGASTMGEGLHAIFGFDSLILELNTNWLAGAKCIPGAAVWKAYGAQFANVLAEFVTQ